MLLLTAASCKKNKTEEQLPPETHVGAFTFGFNVWQAHDKRDEISRW